MVQEMFEDKKERTILQEKLISMKEEKQELLEKMNEMETQIHVANESIARMYEMETQLHDAEETLAKHMFEKEVCKSSLSSVSSQDECFGVFEGHTRGIGSKLLKKRDMKVKG